MLSLNFQNQMFMTEEILGNLAINLLWKTGKKIIHKVVIPNTKQARTLWETR